MIRNSRHYQIEAFVSSVPRVLGYQVVRGRSVAETFIAAANDPESAMACRNKAYVSCKRLNQAIEQDAVEASQRLSGVES